MKHKELKFYIAENKAYKVIEVEGEYRLKKNPDISIMINSNRNSRYITDEKAELIKDKLLGTTNNSLYHLTFFNNAKNKSIDTKKPLRKIEIV